jgi:hypothetical protein
MRIAVCCLCLLAVWNVQAKDPDTGAALRGPWLGLVFDEASKSVRPLAGLPGAATFGPPLELPFALERAAVAHRAGFLLAMEAGTSAVIAVTASGARKLSGVTAAPDRIVFSPSASAAVLYHRERGLVEVLGGLPDHPALVASLDVSTLPAPPSALAVSDDGLVLAACATGPDAAVVFMTGKGRRPTPVLTARQAGAVAFIGSSHDALVADGAANLIYRIRDATGAVAVAGAAEGVSTPVALAASADGKRAAVANAGDASVLLLDLEGGKAIQLSCACQPSLAEPMAGNAVFQVTGSSDPQVWLLDGDAPNPKLLLVPVAGRLPDACGADPLAQRSCRAPREGQAGSK